MPKVEAGREYIDRRRAEAAEQLEQAELQRQRADEHKRAARRLLDDWDRESKDDPGRNTP